MSRFTIPEDWTRLSSWPIWPDLKRQWPWFIALGITALIAIPWGIRAGERNLEAESRSALADAGIFIEDVSFTGRDAVIAGDLTATDQARAELALAPVDGVGRIEFTPAVAAPPPAPPTPPTSTTTTEPPPAVNEAAALSATVSGGALRVTGILTEARAVSDITKMAELLYLPDVEDELVVDSERIALAWERAAADAIAVLPMLVNPSLELNAEGASLIASAQSEAVAASAKAALQRALGADIPLSTEISINDAKLPRFDIVVPGDGTATIDGRLPTRAVRKALIASVEAAATPKELVDESVVGANRPELYTVHRAPVFVTLMADADQWSLRFDGTELSGAVVGGRMFADGKERPTASLRRVMAAVGSMLVGNPDLSLEIEIHSTSADGDRANLNLSRERSEELRILLVRNGIDPDRATVTTGAGDGELLRFRVFPTES